VVVPANGKSKGKDNSRSLQDDKQKDRQQQRQQQILRFAQDDNFHLDRMTISWGVSGVMPGGDVG
jgi:hypothetical protein